ADDRGREYRITITNLTSGQPFTPPVIATHNHRASVFNLGEDSSEEIQSIAENGNNMPLVAALSANPNVSAVVEGTAPLVPGGNPGGVPFESSASYTITASGSARFLSIASMLICTNDGFTGVDSVRLPWRTRTIYAVAYDARSERNTEDFANMVPPCQGLIGISTDDAGTGASDPLLAEDGFVIPHPGVHGIADLQPATHDWSDPVAKIVIERVRRGH
ncbi:MAG: spondin domain-containing protein, partial [Gammaproteobacteria bacterium]|nr:spondin domain-containing protein [Gammaproteobacteria bacterium]